MLMDQQHPITPPTKLIREWNEEAATAPMADQRYIAIQAARWGFRQCIKVDAAWLEDKLQKARDQELEACMEWMRSHFHGVPQWADELRAARRPNPPSLAEQALMGLEQTVIMLMPVTGRKKTERFDIIRRALERLKELESNG